MSTLKRSIDHATASLESMLSRAGYPTKEWSGPNLTQANWKKLGPAPHPRDHAGLMNWRMKQQGMEQQNNNAYGNTVGRLGNNKKVRPNAQRSPGA